MIDYIHSTFLNIFSTLYPLVNNHFISYLTFLTVGIFFAYVFWNFLKSRSKPNSIFGKIALFVMYLCEFNIILFLAWFVLIHFHTFRFFR